MSRRRLAPPSARLVLLVALVAFGAAVVQLAGATVPPSSSPTAAAASNGSKVAFRWSGKPYTSLAALRRDVVRKGLSWEAFLRRNPSVVRTWSLQGVRWNSRVFFTQNGLARSLKSRGVSYAAWAKKHPALAAKLRRNATTTLVRATVASAASSSAQLAPVADTYVDSDAATKAFGSATALAVQATNKSSRHALVRFSLANVQGTVTKATLSVYATGKGGSFAARQVTSSSWSEESTTYANRPEVAASPSVGFSTRGNAWVSIDVTSLVAAGALDIALVAGNPGATGTFASRESGSAPRLAVVTSTPPPPDEGPTDPPPPPATPETTITSGPASTTETTATFAFSSSIPSSSFQCALDGAAFSACASPHTYSGLATGERVFRVRASANGSTDPTPAEHRWTIGSQPSPPPATGDVFGFGFANGHKLTTSAELQQQLSIGANWNRVDFPWAWIEQYRGTYNWASWDQFVDRANAAGVKVIATLAYTPAWARPGGTAIQHEPDDQYIDDYARFAAEAVKRYAPRGVRHFEIWNEQNIRAFWQPKPNPAKYTVLLKKAYAAIKATGHDVVVLSGGLSPAGSYDSHPLGGNDVNPVRYLQESYRLGAAGSFDALGHHPYDHGTGPYSTHPASAWFQMQGTSPSLRSLMVAHGDGAKKIHATEFGIPSAYDGNTEEKQAKWIRDAVVRWRNDYPWAGVLAMYLQKDGMNGGSTSGSFWYYGLTRTDGSLKPSWYAFRDALS